jgi:hypothetical protein
MAVVSTALVVACLAGSALAQNPASLGTSPQAQAPPAPQTAPAPQAAQAPLAAPVPQDPVVLIGARCPALGAALKGLTDAGLGQALTAWMAAYDAKYGQISKQSLNLLVQSYQETDPARKAELTKQSKELRAQIPTSVQRYASIREALKGTLTQEELATVDAQARNYTTNGVGAAVESFVKTIERISKASLTGDQKALIAPIEATAKAAADKLPLGTNLGSKEMITIVAAANQDIIKNVLTDAQRGAMPTSVESRSR